MAERVIWFEMDDEKRKKIRQVVDTHFHVYDQKCEGEVCAFFCDITGDPEKPFDALVEELKKEGMVPILRHEGGEHIVYVTVAPKRKPVKYGIKLNIALLIATIITTTIAGATFVYGNANIGKGIQIADIFGLKYLLDGTLYFSLPLMLILGVHELGHYFVSKRHGIDATLPYFIPVPPFIGFPLGTMGAFISTKEPITDKKALMDIGVAGPICGLLVAIPVTIIGLWLNAANPILVPSGAEGLSYLGTPLLFDALSYFFRIPPDALMHPTAFAGWVGMLVTAMNLLPAGQLDGGHVMRALLGSKQKIVSFAVLVGMAIAGFFFSGWLFFAFLIMLMGIQHPPPLNDDTPLDTRRKIIGIIAIIILILCFVPVPMSAA
ncbi:MAG: site-2 protease family protein [Candidatus Thermoplasmatota archaeon]|nr:site-2 protease family protein [Candidatus Thermoplasmatota archaeon]